MSPDVVLRYAAPVPRYTSYPTANHFTSAVGGDHYARWLAALPPGVRLSVYLHIPFCRQLCWYCGCSTKATQRYEPVTAYIASLVAEIDAIATRLPADHSVIDIHWGGGSPDILAPADIRRIAAALRASMRQASSVEHAVEIDPRVLTEAQVEAFAAVGVTRLSVGVQDFDPAVQKAIGREQSFETTRRAIESFRAHGVRSVNIDLVYGLPHQTRASVQRTIEQVLTLAPDRIALFGYAHLPDRMKHQRLIDAKALPGSIERYGQAARAARVLERAGYKRIGLDHFALPTDDLARGPVHRNFQGYTSVRADALIGLGATAISALPEGFAQNAAAIHDYSARIAAGGLATVRGFALAEEDRARAHVIERLMCDLRFSTREIERRFGAEAAAALSAEAEAIVEADRDRLVIADGDGFRLTARGRPFVRSIAACFDAYLGTSSARHSAGV